MRRHVKASTAGLGWAQAAGNRTFSRTRIAAAFSGAICLLALCALTAAPALAKEVHLFSTSFAEAGSGNGQLSLAEHSGIAVNQTSHDLYVADTGNHRVEQFEADGSFVRTFSSLFNPRYIAIDNSAGPSGGDVYVADTATNSVSKFQANGAPVTSWGTGGQLSGFGAISGIAVGPTGSLFVLEENATNREYAEDSTAGAVFEAPYGSPPFGLAIDAESHLYKIVIGGEALKYATSGEVLGIRGGGHGAALTVDPFDNDLYVAQREAGGDFVNRYALSCGFACSPVETFGAQEGISNPQGIAVDATSHHVYVANAADSTIAVFTLQNVEPPSVTIDAPSAVTYEGAHLSGEVDPEGHKTTCRFEYVTGTQFQSEGFEGAQAKPCAASPGSGSSPTPVQADLSGLQPGTSYHVRLAATNAGGTSYSAEPNPILETEAVNPPEAEIDPASSVDGHSAHLSGTVNSGGSGPGEKTGTYRFTCSPSCPGIENAHSLQAEGFADGVDHAVQADVGFGLLPETEYTVTLTVENPGGEESDQTTFTTTADPPQANTAFVAPRTTTTARLNAYVDPRGSETTYYFQYGPNNCSANPCTSVPATQDAVAGSDLESHLVSQEVEGLSESTTYHYRVVAENATGITAGVDKTFETRSAAEMTLAPRGYELVNPPDKGNQNITMLYYTDGLGGRDTTANTPDGEAIAWQVLAGAPGGTTGAEIPFLSTRGPDGWSTISMVGSADKQVGGGDKALRFISASPDLSHFILSTAEGVLTNFDTTVVRADRAGDQEALATFPHEPSNRNATDVSEDTRHVLHRDEADGKLYDYGSGTPKEVGLLPDGSSPTCGVGGRSLGFYEWPFYHFLARNGSRAFFESQGDDCSGPENLYVRNLETEETTEVAPKGALIRASRDGKRAVFSTSLALTGEDPNSTADLYMWSDGSGNKCLTCSVPNVEVGPCLYFTSPLRCEKVGAVEVPEDLSRVYFRSPNELIPGERKGGGTYVAMADGSIHYAGDFPLIPQINDGEEFTRLTPDGRGAVIHTNRRLTDDEIACKGCSQYYYYDDTTRSTECLTCVHGGVTKQGVSPRTHPGGYEISADGHTVVFATPEKLLPGDVNGGSDIYQWHNGKLGLITDGVTKFPGGDPSGNTSQGAPIVRGISADGRDIFFSAAAPLTGFEHDNLSNLYDARIGGGFPPPSSPVHCDGDSCQGSLEVQPGPVRSASSTFSGNGNVAEGGRPRCRRAKVRRKGRCVSKRPSCRKQAKAKGRCAKRQASAAHKRSQRNDGGGAR